MMQAPLQIVARGFTLNSWWRDKMLRRSEKLLEFCGWITHCRVVAESRHKHSHKDREYAVRIDISIPRRVLVINREAEPTLNAAIDMAFDAAERRLEESVRLSRHHVKTHAPPAEARVVEKYPDAGYGFLETPDERRIYFHQNSVLKGLFRRLTPGSRVHFVEEQGDKGPQARTVSAVRLAPPPERRKRRLKARSREALSR
ncbi:MAG: HPF/RaiA family ribosome-associated protein [Elusimicrobia bacterium]|nr:HPF/RaiA family ribosome-associated protein [Elusimicrobiota bacterium]